MISRHHLFGLCAFTLVLLAADQPGGWGEAQDPDRDSKITQTADKIQIEVPGTYHDLWPEGKVNAPRVLRDGSGDFTFEVQSSGEVTAAEGTAISRNPFLAATIVLWVDEKNFVRLDRASVFRDGKQIFFAYFHVFVNGKRTVQLSTDFESKPTWLRLVRRGDKITASARQDASAAWRSFPQQTVKLPDKVKVGVAALNNTNQPFTAEFADLKITEGPPKD
jgi:regulation of enolase protein 1 (concanavalin A-like superfamily)